MYKYTNDPSKFCCVSCMMLSASASECQNLTVADVPSNCWILSAHSDDSPALSCRFRHSRPALGMFSSLLRVHLLCLYYGIFCGVSTSR